MSTELFLVLVNEPIPISFNVVAKDYESISSFMDSNFDRPDYEALSAKDIINLNDYINLNGEGTYCVNKITESNQKINFNKIKFFAPDEKLDINNIEDYILFSKEDLIISIVGFAKTIEENNNLGKVEFLEQD